MDYISNVTINRNIRYDCLLMFCRSKVYYFVLRSLEQIIDKGTGVCLKIKIINTLILCFRFGHTIHHQYDFEPISFKSFFTDLLKLTYI